MRTKTIKAGCGDYPDYKTYGKCDRCDRAATHKVEPEGGYAVGQPHRFCDQHYVAHRERMKVMQQRIETFRDDFVEWAFGDGERPFGKGQR